MVSETKSLRSCYDRQLRQLQNQLEKMGTLCARMLAETEKMLEPEAETPLSFFIRCARETAETARETDRLCLLLILRQQPVSRDLMLVTTASRASSDLERIAHLCLELARTLRKIRTPDCHSTLKQMNHLARQQLSLALSDVYRLSPVENKELEQLDDRIDQLFEQLKTRLIINNEPAKQGVEVLMAAKYLERIADHCVLLGNGPAQTQDLLAP